MPGIHSHSGREGQETGNAITIAQRKHDVAQKVDLDLIQSADTRRGRLSIRTSQSHPARVFIRHITMNPRKSPASRMHRHAFHQVRSHTADCPRTSDIIAHSSHVRVFSLYQARIEQFRARTSTRSISAAYKDEKCCTLQ